MFPSLPPRPRGICRGSTSSFAKTTSSNPHCESCSLTLTISTLIFDFLLEAAYFVLSTADLGSGLYRYSAKGRRGIKGYMGL